MNIVKHLYLVVLTLSLNMIFNQLESMAQTKLLIGKYITFG